jgi:hypothetical protein
MLAMKQFSRKTWCRGAFLTLCAAPTLLVAIWIVSRTIFGDGSLQRQDWERELSARLGLTLTIGAVSYPEVGVTELKQVEISAAETGELIARAAAIEVTNTSEGYVVEAFAPEMEATQLGRLSQILHQRLLCQGNGSIKRCEFAASELTLNDKTASRTLVDLQAVLESAKSGPQLTASFHWPEAVEPEHAVEWLLVRDLNHSPPATSVFVNTGQARLPCHLASLFWPPLQRLGPDAEFSGKVTWLLADQGSAELRGTFFGVDLNSLVSEQFPHVLSGKATVRVENAVIREGRLLAAAGAVEVQSGGRISRSFLAAAAEHLQLQSGAASNGSDVLAYRRLAGGFRLDGAKLQLSGNADSSIPGVLITSRTAPLLSAPQSHSASAASLARVLLPDSRVQVPLASQTSSLVRLLPAAAISAASQNSETARRSHTPTRLSPSGSSSNVIHER